MFWGFGVEPAKVLIRARADEDRRVAERLRSCSRKPLIVEAVEKPEKRATMLESLAVSGDSDAGIWRQRFHADRPSLVDQLAHSREGGRRGSHLDLPGSIQRERGERQDSLCLSHNRRYRKMRVTEATRFSAGKTILSTHVGEP